ncbi:acetyltransferase [Cellulomonas chitinilytica]|uniref:Lysine N-acyltransferase MbtK n=1 Tax=Cellulomonas chitinilytica TaxID=398759 RepID=A0A919U3N0_9CELL|nr:acetyltransferase [Cellulomonas chitinilytica]
MLTLRPVDPARDAAVVHAWFRHPASAFWAMDGLDLTGTRDYLAGVVAHPHQDGWLGLVDGGPTFLVETYDPACVLLAGVHDAAPGDLGMHLLVAPPLGTPVHGLTSAVMAATMRHCFDTLGASRVVVEPDVRNTRIAVKNALAGFRVLREVDLPGKRATLAVCTRDDFAASPLGAPDGGFADLQPGGAASARASDPLTTAVAR